MEAPGGLNQMLLLFLTLQAFAVYGFGLSFCTIRTLMLTFKSVNSYAAKFSFPGTRNVIFLYVLALQVIKSNKRLCIHMF